MGEIEKMYENCGIYPDCKARECGLDYCANSSGCGYAVYPDFTAEKQIELIKWLGTKQYAKYTTSLLINIKDTVRFAGGLIAGVCTLNVKYDKQDKDFKNALAGLVNEMWQDLTEEEKASIKNILEM